MPEIPQSHPLELLSPFWLFLDGFELCVGVAANQQTFCLERILIFLFLARGKVGMSVMPLPRPSLAVEAVVLERHEISGQYKERWFFEFRVTIITEM